jgi:uncharacterized protein with FMN-binding domain
VADNSNRKVANGVVALSSAAVLAVYGAGYERTRAAADRFAAHGSERRARGPAAPAGPAMAPVAAPRVPADVKPAPVLTPAPAAGAVAVDDASASAAPVARTARAEIAPPTTPPKMAPRQEAPAAAGTASDTPVAETALPTPEPAPAPAAPAAPAAADKLAYRDGTYLGWGSCRHGDIQASVVIENGRIASATVAQCLTRYSCAWINPLPPQIVKQQGTTFDYVSGATESSDAFQDAVADALSHAQ